MSAKIKSLAKNKNFISFVLGSASALAFAPLYFFPLAIIAFSGLFLTSNTCKNNKQSFFVGWFFGFGQFVFGLYWISISLFVDIGKFFWLLPFALFLIPAVLAIYTGLALLLVNYTSKKLSISGWKKILLLSAIWVLFEYLRSVLFTGFPWNLLGYSLLFSLPLSQFASVAGVHGLSLLAIIFYCSPSLFFKLQDNKIKLAKDKSQKPFLLSIAAIILLIWAGGFYRLKTFQPEIFPNGVFRLVQPNINQEEKWNQNHRYESFLKNVQLSGRPGFENVNYVVWSESAVPYIINPFIGQGLLAEIASASPKNGFVITGALRAEFKEDGRELKKIWNTIFVIDDHAKIAETYDKNHLVPFGEYVPLAEIFPFVSKITEGSLGFSEGEGPKTIKLNSRTPSFSPLICYEGIFPDGAINKNNPPQFLVNLTNDAWFGSSSGPYQHFDMVRMRSIEYGMSTIRVANSGISGLINPAGEVVAAIPLNKEGVLDVMLVKNLPATIYMKLGDRIALLMGVLFFVVAVLPFSKSYLLKTHN
ncbi:MAG: Apolipoprotein N-acyltransferase [Rickettsiaceae bacterium]|jgi:apolipoprotein N-acyltransferase|nr:Apolipoprotein N-acyltransferase [Rickettsiaceae bacterium]